jgi:hypothetical protein
MTDFAAVMRRVITGDDANGESVVILDGPPSTINGDPNLGGLFDIWHDAASGSLDPKDHKDLGPERNVLSPGPGNVKVRWFVIQPFPPGVPAEALNARARERFRSFDAEDHLTDQSKHPAMHKTETIDVICLLQGDVSLILDKSITRIKPGQIVIQRGTSHGWEAHGGPALLLAVLIDRPLAGGSRRPI